MSCSEQSSFHGQAFDRAWSFRNCSFKSSRRKKSKKKQFLRHRLRPRCARNLPELPAPGQPSEQNRKTYAYGKNLRVNRNSIRVLRVNCFTFTCKCICAYHSGRAPGSAQDEGARGRARDGSKPTRRGECCAVCLRARPQFQNRTPCRHAAAREPL